MDLLTAIFTLVLVMDPVGNVPAFLSYLKDVDPRRRPVVVARESCIALAILLFFLFFGPAVMKWLAITPPSLHIAGGVLLFLIAVAMIFPGLSPLAGVSEGVPRGEPFIVPLATPLVAGPSAFAIIMILTSREPTRLWEWLAALVVAWSISTAILLLSAPLSRLLGPRGLEACQRLMGMVLTVIAVQMLLDGVSLFLSLRAA